MHLRALAGLPQLTVLNLYFLHWAESVTSTGLTLLANSLPRLRVLNASKHVLVRPHCWTACSLGPHIPENRALYYCLLYMCGHRCTGLQPSMHACLVARNQSQLANALIRHPVCCNETAVPSCDTAECENVTLRMAGAAFCGKCGSADAQRCLQLRAAGPAWAPAAAVAAACHLGRNWCNSPCSEAAVLQSGAPFV
jgi:hypothetical protein